MHIWYLRRQTARRQTKHFLTVFLAQVSIFSGTHWSFAFPKQRPSREISSSTGIFRSSSPSVTILWIIFHTMWFQRCIFSIKANHYPCVPFVFVWIISYTVFINIYHSETAVVKIRTFTSALLFQGANAQVHNRKTASEFCREPPWCLDTKFASFTVTLLLA